MFNVLYQENPQIQNNIKANKLIARIIMLRFDVKIIVKIKKIYYDVHNILPIFLMRNDLFFYFLPISYIQKKIMICQNIKLEKDNGASGSAIKFVIEVALETWKQAEKNIIKEMRELEQKKINLKSLQSKYKKNATNWFRYEYGESCSDYGMISLNFGGLYGTHGDLKKGWN